MKSFEWCHPMEDNRTPWRRPITAWNSPCIKCQSFDYFPQWYIRLRDSIRRVVSGWLSITISQDEYFLCCKQAVTNQWLHISLLSTIRYQKEELHHSKLFTDGYMQVSRIQGVLGLAFCWWPHSVKTTETELEITPTSIWVPCSLPMSPGLSDGHIPNDWLIWRNTDSRYQASN